jgi:hypothetical protein
MEPEAPSCRCEELHVLSCRAVWTVITTPGHLSPPAALLAQLVEAQEAGAGGGAGA